MIPSSAADSKISEFLRTMPPAYARAFALAEIAEHEKVVSRRGSKLVHAEICGNGPGEWACVVAEESTGLLVLITEALLVHGLSIHAAKVFRRLRADGRSEAVDFLRLQHAHNDLAVGTAEVGAFLQTLSELVAEDMLAASRPSSPPPAGSVPTRVYFELETRPRDHATLFVEAPDSEGLLNAITTALVSQNVYIQACEIRTEARVARDRFDLVSPGGQAFSAVRLCDIQQAVYSALPRPRRP